MGALLQDGKKNCRRFLARLSSQSKKALQHRHFLRA
jgi:hypothetical protein